MNRKLKLALAALLGFSTACSTVRRAPAEGKDEPRQEPDSLVLPDSVSPPRVHVMYGVRGPVPLIETPASQVDQLDPVAEKPVDDTPVMDTGRNDGTNR